MREDQRNFYHRDTEASRMNKEINHPVSNVLHFLWASSLFSSVPLCRCSSSLFPRREASVKNGGGEEDKRQNDLGKRECLGSTAFAPRPHYALGEVGEDQHRRPLVGIAFSPQHAEQRQQQRQRLESQRRTARAQRRQPQFPGEAQEDQRHQRSAGYDLQQAPHTRLAFARFTSSARAAPASFTSASKSKRSTSASASTSKPSQSIPIICALSTVRSCTCRQ